MPPENYGGFVLAQSIAWALQYPWITLGQMTWQIKLDFFFFQNRQVR